MKIEEAALGQRQRSKQEAGYGPEASDACRRAAQTVTSVDDPKKWEAAARAGDLFHPSVWVFWGLSPESSFEKAASLLSEVELRKLAIAKDEKGGNWAAGLAWSAKKVLILQRLGLSPSEKTCSIDMLNVSEPMVEAAFYCAWHGQLNQVDVLREAGMAPPGRQFGVQKEWSADTTVSPETVLQAFALSVFAGSAIENGDRWDRVARWLCSGELGVDAMNAAGDDALKMAITAGAPEMALALMDLGARPGDKNARGETAVDVLDKEIRLAEEDGAGPDLRFERLEPRFNAYREASLLLDQTKKENRAKEERSAEKPQAGKFRV